MNQKAYNANLASWDERVPIHFESAMYREHMDGLRSGGHCLEDHTVAHLGDLTGKRAIHLQCHMGMETVSLARLGAEAVGVDFSGPAVEVGRRIAGELDLNATFVQCNVYDTLDHVEGDFDLVFVTVGALCWLPDMSRWAHIVSKLLKPGGMLYLYEVHPFLDIFDEHETERRLEVRYPYFMGDQPLRFVEPGTYADRDAKTEHNESYEWVHPLSEVMTALLTEGMSIERFEESAECCWPRFDMMKEVTPNKFELPAPMTHSLPFTYTLVARKR